MHDWRADIRGRLSSARLHPQDEAEMVDEISQHLEEQFAELAPKIGAGAARQQLLAQLREPAFDDAVVRRRRRARPTSARTWSSTSLWRDVRYGLRSLRRSPGLLAAGTAALALGIGLTTMMYSIIYGTLIKGLPFEDASKIAYVSYNDLPHGIDDMGVPLGDFMRYRARQHSYESFGAYALGNVTVSGGDRPDRVGSARLSAAVFDVLKVRAMLGRTFTPSDNEPGAPPTAILGYAMWRDRYAADSGAIGQTVRVSGRPYTIIGVMPEKFNFLDNVKIWLPLQVGPATLRPGEGQSLGVIGRLGRGVDYDRANAEISGLLAQLVPEKAPGAGEIRAVVLPYIRATMPTRVNATLYVMLGAVMLVLLVACANVANLLLDRTVSRTREIGIRTALGASRLAVVRQSLVESAIIAALAAVVGTGLAQAGIMAFNRAFPSADRRFWMDYQLHPPVLLFVLAMAVVATLVSGLLPAIQSSRLDISAILKDESHAASALRVGRMSRTIVAMELALSSAMLVMAGFMTKSIVQLRTVDPGFTTNGVYTMRVTASPGDTVKQRVFFEAVEEQLAALPGVAGAYVGDELPGSGWRGDPVEVEGRVYPREQDYPITRRLAVSPGFFGTFDVRVARGRAITREDRGGSLRVAVVSESFARRNFPKTDPIGKRIRLGGPGTEQDWLTIVGVMPTLYAASMQNPWPSEVLTAFWQEKRWSSASIAARGPSDVAAAGPIRKIVAALDPEVPVYATASMRDVLARPLAPVHLLGTMFVIFGVASLVLAAIGLYAVMAFSVNRRVREMGIRMALGASSADVVRLVSRQGARQILVGISVGFVLGAVLVRAARGALFGVQPNDPAVFALVAAVLGGAAFVACIIPAIRATRVDPVIALRTD